jgi:ABC-type antimicrobial peptide transport system permease subunit
MGDAAHSGDFEIVGVVEDAKYQDARRPAYPTFFVPFLQLVEGSTDSFMTGSHYIRDIELLVAGKAEGHQKAVRLVLADINPDLTILDSMTLTEQVSRNFNLERLFARLTMLFGLLALILACVGLYGVTSYSVSRRTREIGLRMALGATRGTVTSLVLGGALGQLLIGLALGIPVALAGGRLLGSQLYGVGSYDAVVLGLTAGTLAVCALVAAFVPARRATAIDPMQALRSE